MSDSEFIIKCRKQIEKKLNWLDPENLKQRDFQYLADVIFEKTKTQLSLSTIKRIWDDTYNKSFQINTLDALAQYLDYQNWHHFKELNFEKGAKVEISQKNIVHKELDPKRSLKIKLFFIASIIVLIASLILISKFRSGNNNTPITESEIFFSSKKSVKQGVPNTIIFDYNIGENEPDSLCIQLSWNVKEREDIRKEDRYYTCTYYYPGYHYAKLILDNQIVKGHYVHITTDGWLTLVRYKPDDVIPIYVLNSDVISDGNMYASPYLLKLNNVDVTSNEFYVSYFNIREFENITADNFSFETEIKISAKELALICQTCWIYIYGEYGSIVLPICSQGCVSDIGILAGDRRISGKTNDLSGLGCDLSDWRKVRGEIVNKNFKVYIDDTLAYELNYNKSIGKIKGWHYFFKGCGAVKNLNIYDENKTISYKENFKR